METRQAVVFAVDKLIETNRLNDLHCLDLVTMQWSLVMADTGTEVIFASV